MEVMIDIAGEKSERHSRNEKKERKNTGYLPGNEGHELCASSMTRFSDKYSQSP